MQRNNTSVHYTIGNLSLRYRPTHTRHRCSCARHSIMVFHVLSASILHPVVICWIVLGAFLHSLHLKSCTYNSFALTYDFLCCYD